MTEETVTPDAVTDSQVDEFFDNAGSFEPPVEEVKEEPKVEEPKVEPKPEEEKKVNLGALHEERARRKQEAAARQNAEKERDELRQQLQRYSQPQQENDDPLDRLQKEHEQVKNVLVAQANKAIQEQQENEYWGKVKDSEIAYKQDKPDFDAAIKYLADTRIEELKDLGFDEQGAQKVLRDEIRWIADKAYQDEVNPAERFHNLAKRRGFKVAEEKPVVNPAATKKLDTIKKGMETNKAMPPASMSVKQDLTAEDVAGMKVNALTNIYGQNDFDKAWEKLFGS